MKDLGPIRFGLRTMLLFVTIVAVAIAIGSRYLRPGSVRTVTTRSEWDYELQSARRIVFVDADWSVDTVAFRRPFAEFADWYRSNSNVQMLSMKINSDTSSDDVLKICKELWLTNQIPPGGLKHFGGAGRVLWIDNGKIVDYCWCMELMSDDEGETIEALKKRTQLAFP